MSWQEYIDTSLVGTGNIDKAIICDVTGATIWAASPGFSVTEAERKAIAAAFQDATSVRSNGVMIGGEKYFVLDVDEENLKAKKQKEGLIAYKTTQALLIAHHSAEVQTTNAFATVADLAVYLKGVGY